ncbi:ATP-binding cassette domain-containing protein [Enterococcus cecorum]
MGYQFGNHAVFTNLSLNLERGKKYAIVGQSGSGKSTLLALLLGNLRDYHGKIFYNETDLQTLDENSLLKRINFVSNQTHIFQDTLRNNLTLWDEKITDAQLLCLLEQMNLTDFQSKLAESINEHSLSTGQKQRIGIIRALLHPREILILDEALANLDQQNAQKIEQLFLKQPDLTYLTITHHLTSERAAYFDEVVRLEA